MIERRGFNLDLSFGAFNKDQLVGFTLNGIGDWNGKLTAYDTGTGIIKEFRKKGVATKLFNESLPTLRENNISQYLLEVIRTNTSETSSSEIFDASSRAVNGKLSSPWSFRIASSISDSSFSDICLYKSLFQAL